MRGRTNERERPGDRLHMQWRHIVIILVSLVLSAVALSLDHRGSECGPLAQSVQTAVTACMLPI